MARRNDTVTIKDVAAAAGVSASTVSLILNNKGAEYRIAESTRAKVLDIAESMNYKTNLYARNLAIGSATESPIICVFWEDFFEQGPLKDFCAGLREYNEECGRNFEFAIHPYQAGSLSSMSRIVTMGLCQGIIVTGFSEEDEDFLMSISPYMPLVLFNRDLNDLNAVYINNYAVGQSAAKCLFEHNPFSFVCVNPNKINKNPGIRFAGFYDACIQAGVQYNAISVVYNENSFDGGYRAAEQLLKNAKLPIGAFVSGDLMLAGFVKCLNDHKLSIPGDGFVVCFGNNTACEIITPTVTSILPPSRKMGYDCLRMIDQSMSGLIGKGNVKTHNCEIVYRDSCPTTSTSGE